MTKWRNRPTFKKNWPEDIDVILFIDENGNTNLKNIQQKIIQNKKIGDNEKFFTITGCAIKKVDFIQVKKDITDLKEKHWRNGLFEYGQGVKRVCFHSREIRKKEKAFNENVIDRDEFLNDLSEMIKQTKMKIFSSTINNELHCRKYLKPVHPYDLCLLFLIERFVKFYLKEGEKALIILEARGKKEDKEILDFMKSFIDRGNNYIESREIKKKIKGVYFNPKWCEDSNDKKSYFCLELADLVSHPIYRYGINSEKNNAFLSIENKIYNYPYYKGQGIKIFP